MAKPLIDHVRSGVSVPTVQRLIPPMYDVVSDVSYWQSMSSG